MSDEEQPERPEDPAGADGASLARGWLDHSPFVAHLGIRLEEMEPDRARLSLPFSDALPTMGDVVHGGAISSLIDTAAATAAWSGAQVPDQPRASTVGITVDFLAPARAAELTADARVVRRTSRGLCFIEVAVSADGDQVALALVTYQL
ncbi:MAG TPA: PaaI family thioesterase [Solirubrobacterales bacterium]|jgi:uncharacterized protein (TIGR00369 family)|nr:PaaI family thioesterase [Solirubrobacterales bacterium]